MGIERISIAGWSREQWEADRRKRKTIGGSDAGAVLGLSKYATPYSLWAQKTGAIVPEDISDKEAVRLGVDLEEYVARRWTEATGKKLKRDNHIILNTDYPFAHANVDRLVIGEPDAGFEAKTTSSFDRLDRSVMDQIIGTHEGAEEITFGGYTADTDRNTVLLVPAPYDEMYIRWLEAQIDYQNEEYDLYNVSITLYNNLFSYYSAVYNRDHMPIQRVKRLSF